MRGEQKQKSDKLNFEVIDSAKFGPHHLLAKSASLPQYIGAGFHSSVDFFTSLSQYSQLYPYIYISLPISISFSLPIFISFSLAISFLAISISLYYTENKIIQNRGLKFAAFCLIISWGHCLKIVFYLAETETDKIKDDSKIKK
jgi:hypothetical protein